MRVEYRVELAPDDNGTLLVTCPELPAVTTFGADEADALHHALDAVAIVLAAMMVDGDDIPKPDGSEGAVVRLSLFASLKLELYWALDELGVSRLDRQSRLDDLEAAFASLGRRIDVDARRAA